MWFQRRGTRFPYASSMPSTFTLHEVAEGVWAAVAPGTAGPAVSNATIVDLGDRTLVVDTFMTMLAAEELAAQARRLTGRTAHLVVNSHWHSDHVRGNWVFCPTPIVGTERMRELIVADAPASPEEFAKRLAPLRRAAEELQTEAETEEQRAQAAGTMALADAMEANATRYRLTLPDVLIGDRLEVHGDERRAVILGYGRGHTESDLFVHLPDAAVVVAGDLVWNGIHPKTSDGFPLEWADVVDRIAELECTTVVPGHGPVTDASSLSVMARYLRRVDAMVAAGVEALISG